MSPRLSWLRSLVNGRKSHVMSLVANPGLALFAGLNVFPKKSYLSEYSSTIEHKMVLKMLVPGTVILNPKGCSLTHRSILIFTQSPSTVQMKSLRNTMFQCEAEASPAFWYSWHRMWKIAPSAIRMRMISVRARKTTKILRFISFWKSVTGKNPEHLVFDSKPTTYADLAQDRPK